MRRIDISEFELREMDYEEWRVDVTARTHRNEEEWRRMMETKPKLRTYRSLKTDLKPEKYLEIDDRRLRKWIVRLRSGTNRLRIETGRWKDEEIEDRKCMYCDEVEDERHFVISCKMNEIARSMIKDEIKEMNDDEMFEYILGGFANEDIQQGVVIAEYLKRSWRVRTEYLKKKEIVEKMRKE